MEAFLQQILAVLAIMLTIATSFGVYFVAFTTWYGFKYRRDANLSLRKDYHIAIADTFRKFINNIDNEEVMNTEAYDLKLLGFFNSPLSKKRKLKNFRKKIAIPSNSPKTLLLSQFKNWDKIENDFYIRKNFQFTKFIKRTNLIKDFEPDRKELITILGLLCISSFTTSIDVVKYDSKYEGVIKYASKINLLSNKKLKKVFSLLSVNKNDLSKKQKEEINELLSVNKINHEIQNEFSNSKLLNDDSSTKELSEFSVNNYEDRFNPKHIKSEQFKDNKLNPELDSIPNKKQKLRDMDLENKKETNYNFESNLQNLVDDSFELEANSSTNEQKKLIQEHDDYLETTPSQSTDFLIETTEEKKTPSAK